MIEHKKMISDKNAYALGLAILFIICGIFYIRYVEPPKNFPESTVVRIDEGETLSSVAEELETKNVIRSPQWFSNFVVIVKGESGVIAGDYYFDEPQTSFQVAKRVSNGMYGLESIRVTLPEGLTVQEMALVLDDKLPLIDKEVFISKALNKEGYLFPDTYYFQSTAREDDVINRMNEEFEDNISLIEKDIREFGKPLEEVIIMASILEEEAVTTNDRRLISGLLWKRIRIGMPLQVDASFLKVNGKNTYELTRSDLKIDSPYNTYLYKGLPPAPITNPGLDSILAAVKPIESPFLYYLSEEDGAMHYAETLEEHNENKRLYIP